MKKFAIERLSFKTINELPGSWKSEDYKELLKKMDYENPDEIKDAELKEMSMMSITDFEPREAAQIVLDYLFADKLSKGQIENLAPQMLTEKMWEEYPDLSLHEDFFKATQLLYTAYNGKFPRAEAVQLRVKLTADDKDNLSLFDEYPEAPLVRLLAAGMDDHALIKRLFSDQLEGTKFEEAKNIIWQLQTIEKAENYLVLEIVSSSYWLEDLKYVTSYEASSHADRIEEEED